MRKVYSADPQHSNNFTAHTVFSRDVELSIPAVGVPVPVLLLDSRAVTTLSSDDLASVLGFCAFFIDMDRNPNAHQPAQRRARQRLDTKRDTMAPSIQKAPGLAGRSA